MCEISACSRDQYPQFIFKKETDTVEMVKDGFSVTIICAEDYMSSDESTTSTTATCNTDGVMELSSSTFECVEIKSEFHNIKW